MCFIFGSQAEFHKRPSFSGDMKDIKLNGSYAGKSRDESEINFARALIGSVDTSAKLGFSASDNKTFSRCNRSRLFLITSPSRESTRELLSRSAVVSSLSSLSTQRQSLFRRAHYSPDLSPDLDRAGRLIQLEGE
jgi:hypothetical protein